jgi:hypothetical protein
MNAVLEKIFLRPTPLMTETRNYSMSGISEATTTGGQPAVTFGDLAVLALVVGGLIAVAITCTICVQVFRGKDIPQPLWNIFSVVIGFYFGSFVQSVVGGFRGGQPAVTLGEVMVFALVVGGLVACARR